MKKYDIILVNFVFEDDKKKFKIRPAVVMDNKEIYLIVAKITSHSSRTKNDYLIEDWKSAGLKTPSIIRLDKTMEIKSTDILKKIGTLSENDIKNLSSNNKKK